MVERNDRSTWWAASDRFAVDGPQRLVCAPFIFRDGVIYVFFLIKAHWTKPWPCRACSGHKLCLRALAQHHPTSSGEAHDHRPRRQRRRRCRASSGPALHGIWVHKQRTMPPLRASLQPPRHCYCHLGHPGRCRYRLNWKARVTVVAAKAVGATPRRPTQ